MYFQTFYNRKPAGLNGALKDLGIEFEGREHCGKSGNILTLSPSPLSSLTATNSSSNYY